MRPPRIAHGRPQGRQSPEHRRLLRIAAYMNTKARRIGATGSVTSEDLARVTLNHPTCAYCGIDLEIGQGSFDHAIPLDRNGPNTFENLVRCCYSCQREKFTKTPDELETFRATEFSCVVCGISFRPRYADLKRGYGKTCSRRCSGRLTHAS
jgi:5-methylcytosine-specific restriction endonuclease McrA